LGLSQGLPQGLPQGLSPGLSEPARFSSSISTLKNKPSGAANLTQAPGERSSPERFLE
jgi:hypothetical protein